MKDPLKEAPSKLTSFYLLENSNNLPFKKSFVTITMKLTLIFAFAGLAAAAAIPHNFGWSYQKHSARGIANSHSRL